MKEAFDLIKERLEKEKSGLTTWAEDEAFKLGIEKAQKIVSEVEAEYGNPKTNEDRIRLMTENEENLFNNLMQHNSTRYGYELSRLEINTILQSFEELKKRREKEYVQQENVYGENNGQ